MVAWEREVRLVVAIATRLPALVHVVRIAEVLLCRLRYVLRVRVQLAPVRTSTNQLEPVRTLGCHCLRRPEAPAAPIARGICCTLEKMLLSRGGVKRTIICFLAVYWVSLAFLLRRKGIIFLMPTVLRHYHCVSSPPSSVLHVAD